MKYSQFIIAFITLLLFNSIICAQETDSQLQKAPSSLHDPNAYIDFQFPKGDIPLITSQVWVYIKKSYFEVRYNYEDRQTVSLFYGHSFKVGKKKEFEIIPMIGGSFGKFEGITPASTMILEGGWIRGFSQSQYSINLNEKKSNFYFNWTALTLHTYKVFYCGLSFQSFAPQYESSQIYLGAIVSIKTSKVTLEGFSYNFWTTSPMIAIGLQINFE